MEISRRALIVTGGAFIVAAPAIVKVSSLMPIRALDPSGRWKYGPRSVDIGHLTGRDEYGVIRWFGQMYYDQHGVFRIKWEEAPPYRGSPDRDRDWPRLRQDGVITFHSLLIHDLPQRV